MFLILGMVGDGEQRVLDADILKLLREIEVDPSAVSNSGTACGNSPPRN